MEAEKLKPYIRALPDYPKPGVLFRDVTPLLLSPDALAAAVRALAAPFAGAGIARVLGAEARGFLFGVPVAQALGAGFVPLRKPGKLPFPTHSAEYALEYGRDKLEMHRDAVDSGARVLLVDDLLATGGTAAAALQLARAAGAEIIGAAFLIELEALQGRAKLNCPVHSVLQY